MSKTVITGANFEWSFTDEDVVNPDDSNWQGNYNPASMRLWLFHDHGFTLCVVWADNLQDAIDEAVDANKFDRYLLTPKEIVEDYDSNPDHESISYLGNASEPLDISTLGYVEFAAPKLSLVALCGEKIRAISYHV